MNKNDHQPIGDVQPIEPQQGRKLFKRVAGYAMVIGGGFIAFATLLAPTRLSGASRSARLQWLQRQKEVQETIEREHCDSVDNQKPASTNLEVARKQ